MDLQTFKHTYALHDSGVMHIRFLPEEAQLIMEIVLCNYDQSFYQPGEPELMFGELLFTGVSHYNLEAKYHSFDWDEISTVNFIPSDHVGKGILQMVLLAVYFPSREEEMKIVTIEAEDVIWKPLREFKHE